MKFTKILKFVIVGVLINSTVFATFLGDPVKIQHGGSGLATVPSAGQFLVGNAGGTAYALVLMSSDATMSSTGALTIANSAVTNAKMADMVQSTIKGRAAGAGTGAPVDLTATQATAILNNFVGDSGAGGTKGLVPAPSAGDAAAGKFLKADGTFSVPSGAGDVSSNTATSVDSEIALFSSTTGKIIKRATGTGVAHVTSGVLSAGNVVLTSEVSGILPVANMGGGMTLNDIAGTSYTFVLGDGAKAGANTIVRSTNGAATTFTVPTNASVAFPVGDTINISQVGAGKLTIAAAGGVTINSLSGNLSAGGQYVGLMLHKSATNTWELYGNLIP